MGQGVGAPQVAKMLPSLLLLCGAEACPRGEQQQEAQAVQRHHAQGQQ